MARTIRDEILRLNVIINGDDAKNELYNLEQANRRITAANKELLSEKRKLDKAGQKESARYKELKLQLDQNYTALSANEKRMEALRAEIGLTGLTFTQLSRRAQDLRFQINNMTPGSPARQKLEAELQQILARMQQVRAGAEQTGSAIKRMADGFNRYFGLLAAFTASLAGVIMQFRRLIDVFNEFEKSVDGLSALTGLQGEQLEWLTEQARIMSTSTVQGNIRITKSAQDIVDAYTVVGSKMPQLLTDQRALLAVTREAMILAEAGNIDLDKAVDALTNTMNQFRLPADNAAQVINQIAAGAKFGAADISFIGDAVTRFGAAAMAMGINVSESVAMIEVLGKAGLDASKAGTGLKTFLLRSAQQADQFNVSVVGLQQALHNLKIANISTAEMTRMFGTEAYIAAQSLVNNLDVYDDLISKLNDTSVAYEMAAVNTDNNASRLQQARNRAQLLRMELGEKLAPALTFSTNSFSYLVKAIMAAIRFFNDYRGIIITSVAAIGAYTLAVNASSIAFRAYYSWLVLVEKAQKLLNATIKANPLGLLAAGITAVVSSLYFYNKHLNSAAEAHKNAVLSEVQSVNKLTAELINANTPLDRRRQLLLEISAIAPDVVKNIDAEKISIQDLNSQLRHYNESKLESIFIAQKADKLSRQFSKVEDLENRIAKSKADLMNIMVEWVEGDKFGKSNQKARDILNDTTRSMESRAAALSLLAVQERKWNAFIINNAYVGYQQLTATRNRERTVYEDLQNDLETTKIKYRELFNAKVQANEVMPNPNPLAEPDPEPDPEPIQMPDPDYEARLKALQQYYDAVNHLADDNHRKSLSRDQQELLAIDQKYEAIYQKAIDASISQDELNQLQLQHASELSDKEAEIEERLQKEVLELRRKYKLLDSEHLMQEEINQLIAHNDILLLTEEDLQLQIQAIRSRYAAEDELRAQQQADRQARINQEMLNKQIQAFEQNTRLATGLISSITDFRQAAMNRELALVGNNELAKEQIRKRYARKQQTMAAIEAVIQGALGIVKTGANLGYPTAIPFQIIQGLQTLAQIAVIRSQQFARGKYDVIGADDNRRYKAAYVPKAKTGIYSDPTIIGGLGLVAESAPELVVDGPTLRHIQLNYPQILQAIHAARIPQHASGYYANVPMHHHASSYSPNHNPQPHSLTRSFGGRESSSPDPIILILTEISQKLDNPTRAAILYSDIKDADASYNQIIKSVSRL